MCGVFGIRCARARRCPSRVLRPVRAPAPRPGVGGDRGLRERTADGRPRAWAWSRRSSTSRTLRGLRGEIAIGHTRYSTTGARRTGRTRSRSSTTAARARSRSATTATSPTPTELRAELAADGVDARRRPSDTELIAALIANDERAARGGGRERDGASSRAPTRSSRSPRASSSRSATRTGSARSALGRLDGDWVVASETLRARPRRRGVRARGRARASWWSSTRTGVHATQAVPPARHGALCIFEFFYLARPDSRLDGVEIYGARVRMGEQLAARGARRGRPRHADPRLRHARPPSASPARAASRSARA